MGRGKSSREYGSSSELINNEGGRKRGKMEREEKRRKTETPDQGEKSD